MPKNPPDSPSSPPPPDPRNLKSGVGRDVSRDPKRLFLKFRRWDQRPTRIATGGGVDTDTGNLGIGSHVRLALGPHTVFVRAELQNDDGSFTGKVLLALRAPGYSAPPIAVGERLYFWKQNVLSFSPPANVSASGEPRADGSTS